MNSYYSNRIEGQHTRPAEIERALHQDFDADVVLARKQRLALAHMDVEADLEAQAATMTPPVAGSAATVLAIHRLLYEELPAMTGRAEPRPGAPGQSLRRSAAGRSAAIAAR